MATGGRHRVMHWISASHDDSPLFPDQPILYFPYLINGTISGATTLIILTSGLTAVRWRSGMNHLTVHLYRQQSGFLKPIFCDYPPRGPFLTLLGHKTPAAALPRAGPNNKGEDEPAPRNEKCARRAHFSGLQNGKIYFVLQVLMPNGR